MLRLGIIRGGGGFHHESSIKHGGDLLLHILEKISDKYKPLDVFVDKNKVWHIGGVMTPGHLVYQKLDKVWNLSDPSLGLGLQSLNIPHISTSAFSTLVKNDPDALGRHARALGLNTPKKILLPAYQKDFDGDISKYAEAKAEEVWSKFGAPWMVRPYTNLSSMGIIVAKTFDQLVGAIKEGVQHNVSLVVEEIISGKSVSAHAMRGWRGQDIYVFPIQCASKEDKFKIEKIMPDLYSQLGATYYMCAKFTIHPKLGVFVSDVSFHPDLGEESSFREACESVGAQTHQAIAHIISNAR